MTIAFKIHKESIDAGMGVIGSVNSSNRVHHWTASIEESLQSKVLITPSEIKKSSIFSLKGKRFRSFFWPTTVNGRLKSPRRFYHSVDSGSVVILMIVVDGLFVLEEISI
ncbi:unnamed protein product [Brassica rapa subsp. narinosa]